MADEIGGILKNVGRLQGDDQLESGWPGQDHDLYRTDPVGWVEAKGLLGGACKLDPWQREALQATSKQSIWLIHRQAGKSAVGALKALHKALFTDNSLTLMISPSERQSQEIYRKFLGYYDRLDIKPKMVEDRALSCMLENGSRIVALPGIEDTIRSFSAVSLILEDESSRCSDDMYTAVRPMLAVSNGSIVLMSTPNGPSGHFYRTWSEGDTAAWDKIKVTADQCSRISAEFLAEERLNMTQNMYKQEYMCEFVNAEGSVFDTTLFESLRNPDRKSINMKRMLGLDATPAESTTPFFDPARFEQLRNPDRKSINLEEMIFNEEGN